MTEPVASPPVVDYHVPTEVDYAGFGLRLAAWMLDWVILAALRFAVLMITAMVVAAIESANPGAPMIRDVGGWVILALFVLCPWPYYAIMEASKVQATVGKLAAGIRVEDIDGGRATLLQTAVRYLLRFFSALMLGIGFLMVLWTKRRQAFHDIGANTIVTRKR